MSGRQKLWITSFDDTSIITSAIDRHVQFTQNNDVVLGRGVGAIQPDRVRVANQRELAAAEDTIGSRKMKVPVKLLPNRVDQGRVFVLRERIDPLRPERDGEADQEHGLDQNNRKFQVSRDAAGHTLMVCHRVAAFAKTPENEKEKRRPSEKERAHEPMTELDDVIDLVAMLGGIRRQARSVR